MADIQIVDEAGEVKETQNEEIANPQGLDVPNELFLQDIAQLLKIDLNEVSKYKHKLETVIEYAKSKASSDDPQEIRRQIKHLGLRLGTPPLGERIIDRMNLYAKLHLQSLDIKNRMVEIATGEDLE